MICLVINDLWSKTMKKTIGILLGAMLILTGCKTTPNYDYDNSVNFSHLKTYAWVVESKPSNDSTEYFKSDINNKRIIGAIEQQLHSKGFRKVAPAHASILVNFHTTIMKKRERDVANTHPYYWNFGRSSYGSHWGLHMNLNSLQRGYKEGSLIIDIIDKNKQLIWRGSDETRLNKKSTPQKRLEKVNTAVNDILLNFPPK